MSAVASAFAIEAARIRTDAGLTTRQIARATGAAASTVREWLGLRSQPRGPRAVWLNKPIEALGDAKPLDLIAAGEFQRVARVVSAIEYPGAV